ncbi:MAG: hypothetical protein J7M19_06590 [Planctomycetes bacterium]|nr:hypothetical protein [Planctomycetota bacterium]
MKHTIPVLVLVVAVVLGGSGAVAAQAARLRDQVVPGRIEVVATLVCIGLTWPVEGDVNRNAAAVVEYRKSAAIQWEKAMPLWRMFPQKVNRANNTIGGLEVIDKSLIKPANSSYAANIIEGYSKNYFAGSIFNLSPGTTYDVRVALEDPDGGGQTMTIRVKTRKAPVVPAEGNVIDVAGGGDALKDAVKAAKPGDIFLVHAGTYNSAILIEASGTPEKPIVIRGAGDGEVVITGQNQYKRKNPRAWSWADDRERATDAFTVLGSYIHFDNLTIRDVVIAMYFGGRPTSDLSLKSVGIAVTHCKTLHCFNGLFGKASESYFADNRIRGDWHGGSEGDGYTVHGYGNVLCYNTITHTSNGISPEYSRDCDFYNNNVIFHGTDLVELDNGGANMRIFNNRMATTEANGISFQPYIGGPAYIIGNQIVDVYENIFKDRQKSCGAILLNNTFVAPRFTALTEQVYARNNLFLTTRAMKPSADRVNAVVACHGEDLLRSPQTLDLDYDGYNGPVGIYKHNFYLELPRKPEALSLDVLRKETGLEAHGVALRLEDCFKTPLYDKAAEEHRHNWDGLPFPDFTLKPGAPAIDKGVVVPNVIENYQGQAPDLGALESGAPLPHWGPRGKLRTSPQRLQEEDK